MCGRVVGCSDFRGSAPSGTHRKTAQTERRKPPFPTIAQPNVIALNSNLLHYLMVAIVGAGLRALPKKMPTQAGKQKLTIYCIYGIFLM